MPYEEGRAGAIHRGDDLLDVISGFYSPDVSYGLMYKALPEMNLADPKWSQMDSVCLCISRLLIRCTDWFCELMQAICSLYQDEQMMQETWEQLFFIAITSDSISVTAVNLCCFCCYCAHCRTHLFNPCGAKTYRNFQHRVLAVGCRPFSFLSSK